jgi:hypothetical protein
MSSLLAGNMDIIAGPYKVFKKHFDAEIKNFF